MYAAPKHYNKQDAKYLNNPILPEELRQAIYAKYSRIYKFAGGENRRAANLWFLNRIEKCEAINSEIQPTTAEHLIENYAKKTAREISARLATSVMLAGAYCKRKGVPFPMAAAEREAASNDGYIEQDGGTAKRLRDDIWLNRQIRKKAFRDVETIALNFGLVNQHGQRYVSDAVARAISTRKQRNRQLMQTMTMVNDWEQEYTLAELAELSPSNPAIKNTELAVRMRGFVDYANENKHPGDFWTITCPSRLHPSSHKWDGSNPRAAQSHLNLVWSRMRTAMQRAGIVFYGFRVAEPHQDACPHWHMVLYFESKQQQGRARLILEKYSLCQHEPGEPGALDVRYDIELIDPERNAAGYILKYITKNLDGKHISDIDGRDPEHAAARIQAWASVWGIRQFQQIGGAGITVWRELRRLDEQEPGKIEDARQAADEGDWRAYWLAQGGHGVAAKSQPVRAAYWQEIDERFNEVKKNQYGEICMRSLFGVIEAGVYYATRLMKWKIQTGAAFRLSRSSVNNCTGVESGNEKRNQQTGFCGGGCEKSTVNDESAIHRESH